MRSVIILISTTDSLESRCFKHIVTETGFGMRNKTLNNGQVYNMFNQILITLEKFFDGVGPLVV